MAVLDELQYKGVVYELSGLSKEDGLSTYDLAIADDEGNVLVMFKNGHIKTKYFDSSLGTIKTVDANGNGDYRKIQDAINGTSSGDTIIVYPGIYREEVEMWGKNRHIVGVCKETCILTNGTGNYDTPPLEANIGSVENMTIIADNYSPTIPDPSGTDNRASYAIHIEYANPASFSFRISNCILKAKWFPAVGLGLRYNQVVTIENCELTTDANSQLGAMYFHNDAESNNSGTGRLVVSNTRFKALKQAIGMSSVSSKPGLAEAEFLNCTFKSDTYDFDHLIYKKYTTQEDGYLCGNRVLLADSSHGNNVTELNA